MGILDKVVGAVTGGSSSNPLMGAVMGMISGGDGPGNGIGGLISGLKEKGLGSIAQSWVGSGKNEAISADQVSEALGAEKIAELATQSGLQPSEVSNQLSEILPQAIDKATPNGEVPGGSLDLGSIGSMLGGLFGK